MKQRTPFEIELIGFKIIRPSVYERLVLVTFERDLQPIRNREGDLVFKGEDVLHVAVITLRPQLKPICHIYQLGGNPDSVSCLPDASFQDRRDAQLARNLSYLNCSPLEGERRRPRRNP